MARYNKVVNTQLYDLLDSCEADLITKDTGSYFGSILGLLNHLLLSDLGWLSAYRDGNHDLPVLASPVLDFDHPGWKNSLYDNLAELRNHRNKTDLLFQSLVDETPEELFDGVIEVTRSNGKTRSFPFGKVLMHLFNHQTHHRGAISQILDQEGVENDYSNLMRLLME